MILDELEVVLRKRKSELPLESYSAALFRDPERIGRKLTEETFELCVELGRAQRVPRRIAEEAADLIYHLLVALVEADVALGDVLGILQERRG